MYRRGPRWGGGPFMRRGGVPLLMGGMGMGMGMGMGGLGMGGFGGGSLLGDLAAGGIGYMLGNRSAQQQQYQTPQYQPQPQYQAPQYQAQPQYQAPQYQAPQPQYQAQPAVPYQQAPAAGAGNETLAQLKLLGHLRESGMLTNDEFEAEKQKILHG